MKICCNPGKCFRAGVLVALALFVLLAGMPAAAISPNPATGLYNGSVIRGGYPVPTVFVGEDQLNLTPIFGQMGPGGDYVIPAATALKIGWWAPGTFSFPDNPSQVIDVSTSFRNFAVSPPVFGPYTGTWYCLTAANTAIGPAFIVADPYQAVAVIDVAANSGQGQEMTGKSVVRGSILTIKVDTNLAAFTSGGRVNNFTGYYATYGPFDPTASDNFVNLMPNFTVDGFISLKLRTDSGQVHSRVFVNWLPTPGSNTPLTNLWVNTRPWYLGSFMGNNGLSAIGWDTGALDPGLGTAAYPEGTYTVWSESTLSRMRDNYKLDGADFTGKTVSAAVTVTLLPDTVTINANMGSIVRGRPFSVTITGRPLTTYWVWVKGTSGMSGNVNDQPPMVGLFQDKVYLDPRLTTTWPLGQYQPENSVTTILGDVPNDVPSYYNRTRYYCMINTSTSGTRTIEFVTTNWTKEQTYTIRVERDASVPNQGYGPFVNPNPAFRNYKSDQVNVRVEKGAVTLAADGDQSYDIGELVHFSGTNSNSYSTFLFMTGPGLPPEGAQLQSADPKNNPVVNGVPSSFVQQPVNSDTTWGWNWNTQGLLIESGIYTIIAASEPVDALHLANASYASIFIVVKNQSIENFIPLYAGWNFVSTPKKLQNGNDTVENIFSRVDTAGHSVFFYNASVQSWHSMTVGEKVRPLDGIWIYSNTTSVVPVIFDTYSQQTPPSKSLAAGWNAIGFADTTPTLARNALISVQDKWAILIGYNPLQQRYETSIIKGATDSSHGDYLNMYPTKGYWMYMTGAGEFAAIGL